MCHSDQKLHEHVQKGSKEGFWPTTGEALVGGSYVLMSEDVVVKDNLYDLEPHGASKVRQFPELLAHESHSLRTDKKAGIGHHHPWLFSFRLHVVSQADSKPSLVLSR